MRCGRLQGWGRGSCVVEGFRGWGRGSCVVEGFSLADPKRGISVHENAQNYGITKERFQIFFHLILSKIL